MLPGCSSLLSLASFADFHTRRTQDCVISRTSVTPLVAAVGHRHDKFLKATTTNGWRWVNTIGSLHHCWTGHNRLMWPRFLPILKNRLRRKSCELFTASLKQVLY